MARSTNRALTERAKLRQSPKPKKTVSSNKDGSSQTSRLSQKGKAIQENSMREGNTSPEHRGKRRRKEEKEARGSEERKEVPPSATPRRNQAKDHIWTTVVKRGIRKEAMRPNNDGTEKTVLAHITIGPRPARPDAFKIKKCVQSTYANILRIIKGAAHLKDLQERVTRIRRTKAGELLLEMDKSNVVTPELQTLVRPPSHGQR